MHFFHEKNSRHNPSPFLRTFCFQIIESSNIQSVVESSILRFYKCQIGSFILKCVRFFNKYKE